ncbi:hypothetical protein GCK32_003341 [Trichostrongylus colubriformis]|uniref:Uncharacterized protein n=1 Tax=Trichostrongylus colubriformis TaxID=6319 RepID=A0AAN8G3Z6_TRICO
MRLSSDDSQCSTPYEFLFKLLVIGESSVGKSSLLRRFTDNVFHQSCASTVAVDFKIRTLMVDNSMIKLQIKFADEYHLQFIETSAKSAENVEECDGRKERKVITTGLGEMADYGAAPIANAFLEIAKQIKNVVAPTPYLAPGNVSIRLGEVQPVSESSSSDWWYC